MKVTFINRVYPPAHGATGQLLSELAPALVECGFEVTVLTSGRARRSSQTEVVNGLRVERVHGLPFTRTNLLLRALMYLSLYPALLWRALRLPACDVLITMTDPPLLLLLGPIIAFFKGCRLVHWAQDIYPELAEELGVLRGNSWVANLCRGLSTAALRKNSRIIALGRCMKERLLLRGLPEGMIDVVPNWAPGTITADDAQAAANFRRLHDIGSKFVVMYSGNFGLAHSFDEILEAAQALQPKRPDVLFLMVGDGPRLARLKERAAQLQLSILRFIPPQPADALSAVLGSADVHLVTMAPESCGLIVPSKLYGILAAGRPCLFIGPAKSEAALLIEEHQCGAIVSSGAELASSILTWAEHPEQRRATGLRAKAAAMNFTTKTAATEFSRLLRHCVRPLPVIAGARSLASKAA